MRWVITALACTPLICAGLALTGCDNSCAFSAQCAPVTCKGQQISYCADYRPPNANLPWPHGAEHLGHCISEDECEELEGIDISQGTGSFTSSGSGFTSSGSGPGSGGAGGSPFTGGGGSS